MIYELAQRVKKGVKLLDKHIPNWRRTIKAHKDQFDFMDGDCCVLGTLEHYNGRMRVLKARKGVRDHYRFTAALKALGVDRSSDYGFDIDRRLSDPTLEGQQSRQYDILTALWKAEIGL
jgi:hypothetical protein